MSTAYQTREDPREVERALQYFNADDRREWIQLGMAVRDALGDDGRAIWMRWSASSPKFNEKTASDAWRSFKPGPITAGTLFGLARRRGWRRARTDQPPPRFRPDPEARAREQREQHAREQRAATAAERAREMLQQAVYQQHPYLDTKSPGRRGLVLENQLLIPMRSIRTGEVQAVQAIQADGSKKYRPAGCSAAECIYTIGPRGGVVWWVEGYATGLAVRDALDRIHRARDRVVVCFSSGQLTKLPQRYPKLHSFVVADHDWWRCRHSHRWDYRRDTCPQCGDRATPPAGSTAAAATGLPWWEPPNPGTDAWDFAARSGLLELGNRLLTMARLSTSRRLL